MSDSEDESIEDTIEVTDDPILELNQSNQDPCGNTDKILNVTEKNEKLSEEINVVKDVMDKIGNRFDELVENEEKTNHDDKMPNEVDQTVSTSEKVTFDHEVRFSLVKDFLKVDSHLNAFPARNLRFSSVSCRPQEALNFIFNVLATC